MTSDAVLGLSVLLCFVAFGMVTGIYIWPQLRRMPRAEALKALVVPHTFRFVGLCFLVPGVVSPSLQYGFAAPAAYGVLVATVLALAALWALVARAGLATPLLWALNIWGTLDLLTAFYEGLIGAPSPSGPGALGATFFIPTVIVPPLLITHGLMFRLLLGPVRQDAAPKPAA